MVVDTCYTDTCTLNCLFCIRNHYSSGQSWLLPHFIHYCRKCVRLLRATISNYTKSTGSSKFHSTAFILAAGAAVVDVAPQRLGLCSQLDGGASSTSSRSTPLAVETLSLCSRSASYPECAPHTAGAWLDRGSVRLATRACATPSGCLSWLRHSRLPFLLDAAWRT